MQSSSANNNNNSTAKKKLECPVCNKFFQDPRLLDCAHSLCLNCCVIEEGKISCVVCHTITQVKRKEELNYLLRSAMGSIHSNIPPTCDEIITFSGECKKVASYWCAQCEENFFCEDHNSLVHSLKIKKHHKVIKASDTPNFKAPSKAEKKCGEHDEGMKMWCKECYGLICAICVHLVAIYISTLFIVVIYPSSKRK